MQGKIAWKKGHATWLSMSFQYGLFRIAGYQIDTSIRETATIVVYSTGRFLPVAHSNHHTKRVRIFQSPKASLAAPLQANRNRQLHQKGTSRSHPGLTVRTLNGKAIWPMVQNRIGEFTTQFSLFWWGLNPMFTGGTGF